MLVTKLGMDWLHSSFLFQVVLQAGIYIWRGENTGILLPSYKAGDVFDSLMLVWRNLTAMVTLCCE